MTRQEAEKAIVEHLIAIRNIAIEYGMTDQVVPMYVSNDYVDAFMYEGNGSKEYALKITQHVKEVNNNERMAG